LALLAGGLANWLGVAVEVILLYVAFYGAYKRKHRPLRAYVCINILFMVVSAVFLVMALVYMGAHSQKDSVPLDLIYENNTNNDGFLPLKPVDANNTDTPSNHITIAPSPAFFVVSILVVIATALVFVLKVLSIIMAARLARLICAYNCSHLSHPIVTPRECPSINNSHPIPPPAYSPMQQVPMQQVPMYQPMYMPVVVNGQPNGQNQQFVYPYFVPQGMYTPMAPPQDKTQA